MYSSLIITLPESPGHQFDESKIIIKDTFVSQQTKVNNLMS